MYDINTVLKHSKLQGCYMLLEFSSCSSYWMIWVLWPSIRDLFRRLKGGHSLLLLKNHCLIFNKIIFSLRHNIYTEKYRYLKLVIIPKILVTDFFFSVVVTYPQTADFNELSHTDYAQVTTPRFKIQCITSTLTDPLSYPCSSFQNVLNFHFCFQSYISFLMLVNILIDCSVKWCLSLRKEWDWVSKLK